MRQKKPIVVADIEKTYSSSKTCHWKRIADDDNRFYYADLEIDEAGIPTYMAPKVV